MVLITIKQKELYDNYIAAYVYVYFNRKKKQYDNNIAAYVYDYFNRKKKQLYII